MMYVHITVNSKDREYDYTFESADSLDAIVLRLKEQHPSMTSFVMSVCPNKDGMNATFDTHT